MIHDTPEPVLRTYEAMIAARGTSARLRMALDMYDTGRALARAGILRTRPDASEGEVQKLLFLRYYGRDLPQPLIDRVLKRIDERYPDPAPTAAPVAR